MISGKQDKTVARNTAIRQSMKKIGRGPAVRCETVSDKNYEPSKKAQNYGSQYAHSGGYCEVADKKNTVSMEMGSVGHSTFYSGIPGKSTKPRGKLAIPERHDEWPEVENFSETEYEEYQSLDVSIHSLLKHKLVWSC